MHFYSLLYIAFAARVKSSFCLSSRQQILLGEKDQTPFTSDFDGDVVDLLNQWHVPGLSIAVVDGDETFTKVIDRIDPPTFRLTPNLQGYGISSFPSLNVTPSTLFYTGSTTKAFTAAALALLIDDTADSTPPQTWRTPLSSLIPSDFLLQNDYASLHLTLEDAASHRTGMPGHDTSYGGPNVTMRDVVQNLRNLPMTAEPRTKFQYCNMMYMTLSHVLETLTSTPLGSILWNRVWNPLNMTRTYFSLTEAQLAANNTEVDLAEGYMWNNKTQKYIKVPYMDLPFVSGAGNIISNVLDYAKWLHSLMHQSPPLSKAGHASLRHPRTILEDNPLPGFTGTSTYALGWNVENYRGEPLISHTGGTPGFGAIIGYLPQRKYGIVMMGNTAESSSIVENILFHRLLDDYLGIKEEERGDVAAVFEKLIFAPKRKQLADPIKALYPHSPTGRDAIPLSLPLENYTGVYHNSGFPNFTITLVTENEHQRRLQSLLVRVWAYRFDFEHVSGEYFVGRGDPEFPGEEGVDGIDPLMVLLLKVEFRIGEDGKVAEMGADLEPMMEGEKIWFRRVGDVE
ncbi:MAG: hypothetical protein Q9170_002838 [Blastenia crenularia]